MITFQKLEKYGRLGNQLFQIASVIGIAQKNNHSYAFPAWSYNKYFKNQLPVYHGDYKTRIHEGIWQYTDFIIPKDDLIYDLLGYFQNEKYFAEHRSLIKHYLTLTDEYQDRVNRYERYWKENDCFLHVRRGDYLNLEQHHTNLYKTGYYNKALEIAKNSRVVVFSDDTEWCKTVFKNCLVFDYKELDVIEMFIMSKFKNKIIANSSFSWWASWLSDERGLTIAPKQWFGPAYTNDPVKENYDIYLKDWFVVV